MEREPLTREQAIELGRSGWWKDRPAREVAAYQLAEPLLCMDFAEFHRVVEEALGRGVFTHEFANPTRLLAELSGEKPRATLHEVLSLIPKEKLILALPGESPEEIAAKVKVRLDEQKGDPQP